MAAFSKLLAWDHGAHLAVEIAPRATGVVDTELLAWDRATQVTFMVCNWTQQKSCNSSCGGGLHKVAGIGSRYTAYLWVCVTRFAAAASTELLVWGRVTQPTCEILRPELRRRPSQNCWHGIPIHTLFQVMYIPTGNGGLYRNSGMGLRYAACL